MTVTKRNCSQIEEGIADETCLEQGIAPCLYCDGHDNPPVTTRKLTKEEIEVVDFVRYLKKNKLAGIIDKDGNKKVVGKYE